MAEKRARRTFSEEQKKQLVELYNHCKPKSEIIREYDLTASAFSKWAKRDQCDQLQLRQRQPDAGRV